MRSLPAAPHARKDPHSNVVTFRRTGRAATVAHPARHTSNAFDQLTVALIMQRHQRGELDPAILAALLEGVGLELPR